MKNAYANTYSLEGRSYTIGELGLEVQRLRRISERQSEMLAQALFEKNQLTGSDPSTICRLQRHNSELQTSFINLRNQFEAAEECHKRDFELLNRLKNVLKELVRS